MINFEEKFFPPHSVTAEDIKEFTEQTSLQTFKRGSVILEKGMIQENILLVVRGCLRNFVVDARGKEHILRFAPENWLMGDHESLVNDSPAETTIDAIEETVLYVIPKKLVYDLQKRNVKFLMHHNNLLRKNTIDLQRRVIQLLSATAEERYLIFLRTYPELASRLPLKMIASYLGITPESLSRVRHTLVKK